MLGRYDQCGCPGTLPVIPEMPYILVVEEISAITQDETLVKKKREITP